MEQKDQNRVLAFIICVVFLFMYIENVWFPYFHKPTQASPNFSLPNSNLSQADSEQSNSTQSNLPSSNNATSLDSQSSQSAESAPVAKKVDAPLVEEFAKAGHIRIENEKFSMKLELLGGRISELRLKDYRETLDSNSLGLNMVSVEQGEHLPLGVVVDEKSDYRVHYVLKPSTANFSGSNLNYNVSGNNLVEISLRGQLSNGDILTKTFKIKGNSYIFDVAVEVSPISEPAKHLEIEWTHSSAPKSKSVMNKDQSEDGYVWFDGQRARREVFKKVTEPGFFDMGNVRWVTIGDKYFAATLMSPVLKAARANQQDDFRSIRIGNGISDANYQVFVGPKSYRLLEELGSELRFNVNFGKTGFIAAPLLWLLHWFYGVFANYGIAIVLLTISVKTVLYPLNSAAFRQMKRMQDLQPEMQRIRDQYKNNAEQQKIEMMNLYKQNGVNPLGGCLPMLLQLPIFIGLFSALQLDVGLRHAPFAFWINDLSAPEKFMVLGFPIPVMVVLFVISMLLQQWTMPSTMDETQKRVMLIMPVIFGFMFAGMPAGLTLYFLVNNIISISQQRALQNGGDAHGIKVTAVVAMLLFAIAFGLAKLG